MRAATTQCQAKTWTLRVRHDVAALLPSRIALRYQTAGAAVLHVMQLHGSAVSGCRTCGEKHHVNEAQPCTREASQPTVVLPHPQPPAQQQQSTQQQQPQQHLQKSEFSNLQVKSSVKSSATATAAAAAYSDCNNSDGEQTVKSSQGNSWACPKCTLHNSWDEQRCSMCHYDQLAAARCQ
jgi:ribosomal protein L40E